jgi:hypothetical protein
MTMAWFKFPSSLRNDPKFKRLPIAQRYAYIVLMCLANESSDRGVISGLDDEDLAFELEMALEDWQTLKAKFRVKGFLEFSKGEITLTNWEKTQYKKPSDLPEATKLRKQKQRAKSKALNLKDVTLVTPLSHDLVTQIRLDKTRSEEIRSDLVHIEKEISFSQNVCDRTESLKQSETDKWSSQKIDCKALSKDKDFLGYVQTVYLPSVPDYRGKQIDFAQAASWIVKGVRNPDRRDLVEIQYEAMLQKGSRQSSDRPSIEEQDRLHIEFLKSRGLYEVVS